MKRYSDKHSLTTLSELNVTPLIDLAFVLLIIFMITTPLMETTAQLIIPTSVASPEAAAPEQIRTLAIDRDQNLLLDEEPIDLESLVERLRALEQEQPGIAVVIRPHRELPVQNLVDIMDALRRARITRVGVQTRVEEHIR